MSSSLSSNGFFTNIQLIDNEFQVLKSLIKEGKYSTIERRFNEQYDRNIESGRSIRTFQIVHYFDHNDGMTLLMIACQYNQKSIVKLLLNKFARINGQNCFTGNTCLHYAIQNGHPKLLSYLISKGADDKIKNHDELDCYEFLSSKKKTNDSKITNES